MIYSDNIVRTYLKMDVTHFGELLPGTEHDELCFISI